MAKLDDIKALLGITGDNSQDARIELLITMATAQIEAITGYKMAQEEISDETYDGDASRMILMRWMPITGIDKIEFKNGDAWDLVDPENYELKGRSGQIFFSGSLPRGINNVRIKYTAGYATLNPSLDAALNEFICQMYTIRPGVKSESVDGASVSYADPSSISSHPIFSQYIRI